MVGIAAGLDKNGEYIDCSSLGLGLLKLGLLLLTSTGKSKAEDFRNKEKKSF